jgi:hypothetical protein
VRARSRWPAKAEDWQEKASHFTYSAYSLTLTVSGSLAPGNINVQIDLDDLERRSVIRSLVERRGWLIEIVGDTTRTPASRRKGLFELALITSVLRKLRLNNRRTR